MMTDFLAQFREHVDVPTATTLYLRPSALLVRKGNPPGHARLRGLLARPRDQSRVIVTQGAGQRRGAADLPAPLLEMRKLRSGRE